MNLNLFNEQVYFCFRNVAFFIGAPLAVLLALTVWDEDVLKVEHVLTAIALFSGVITICQGFIPDEVCCFQCFKSCRMFNVHAFSSTDIIFSSYQVIFIYFLYIFIIISCSERPLPRNH